MNRITISPLKDPSDRVREFKREQARVDMHTRVVVRASFCFCWLSFYSIYSLLFFFSSKVIREFVIKVEREILIINRIILSLLSRRFQTNMGGKLWDFSARGKAFERFRRVRGRA